MVATNLLGRKAIGSLSESREHEGLIVAVWQDRDALNFTLMSQDGALRSFPEKMVQMLDADR